MRSIAMILLMAGVSLVLVRQSNAANQMSAAFSIAISTDTPVIKVGSRISIKIKLTNTSNHNISISDVYDNASLFDRGVDISYEQKIWDSRNNLVKRNDQSKDEPAITGFSVLHTLKPGESLDTVTNLTGRYDLSQPGKYVIQLFRLAANKSADRTVKSNKITLMLTP